MIYEAGLGNAIQATVGTLVQAVQRGSIRAKHTCFVATYSRFVIPQHVPIYLLMTFGSIPLAVAIWQRKSAFPRWIAALLLPWLNLLVLPLGQAISALCDLLYPSTSISPTPECLG